MGFMAYYLRRARRARDRADIEPYEANRRAWIEVAEIIEARCLLFLGQETYLLFQSQESDQHLN
jgi:hypothetical protein